MVMAAVDTIAEMVTLYQYGPLETTILEPLHMSEVQEQWVTSMSCDPSLL